MANIDNLLDLANTRLKAANTGIKLFKRGNKISLRGMLPPKRTTRGVDSNSTFLVSGKLTGGVIANPKLIQQTISLGLYANAAGIKVAELEAFKLSGLIALNQFDWADYSKTTKSIKSARYWIEEFEKDYFNKRDRNPKTETTWKDYCKVFNCFETNEILDNTSLLRVVLLSKPDTRSRVRACTYTKILARFAGIDFNPDEYKGTYSSDSVDIRDIPSDLEIQQWRDKIPNDRGLKYAFGLMAAYGLRNYELFHVDLDSLTKAPGHLRIIESKRNKKRERLIWCLYPEWYQAWNLGNINQNFPKYTGKSNSDLGNRIGNALRAHGFTKAYNLRHAWAIRSISFLPIELAATMMDHDIAVHRKTYHRFLKASDYERFYKIMMKQSNRPKPPID